MSGMEGPAAQAVSLDDSSLTDIPGLPSYKELHQIVTEIKSLIEVYDPLDLVASLAFENLSFSTSTNPPDNGAQVYVEYLALLCLKSGQEKGANRIIPPGIVGELQQQ